MRWCVCWCGRPLAKLNALPKFEPLFAPITTIISWNIGNPTESMLRVSTLFELFHFLLKLSTSLMKILDYFFVGKPFQLFVNFSSNSSNRFHTIVAFDSTLGCFHKISLGDLMVMWAKPRCEFTWLYPLILFEFTICLKFQLTSMSARLMVAIAMCKQSSMLDLPTTRWVIYSSAKLIICWFMTNLSLNIEGRFFKRLSTWVGAGYNSLSVNSEYKQIIFPAVTWLKRICVSFENSFSKYPPKIEVSK